MELTAPLVNKKLLTPTFICIWIIMFLVEFVKGALIVAILPVYMGGVLKLSAFAIGLSFSLQYIGDNVFRSPAGWLIERIGFRITMMLGLIIAFGAVSIIALTQTMGFIVLGCALLGIGTAPLWPCVMMGISSVTKESKNFATAMGVIQISCLGGTGAGPVIINFFVNDSYKSVFWILLSCLALVIIVALFLPGRKAKVVTIDPAVAPLIKKKGLRASWNNLRQTWSNIRENLDVSPWLYPALFLQSFAIGLLTPVITLFVRTELGMSPQTFSFLLVAGGGITVLGLVPVGKLADRFGTKWFLHTGFLLSSVAIGLFAVSRSVPVIWLLVMLIGLSYACILPTWDTMIAHMLPEGEKGTVWGLFLTIQGSGMVIGPIVSGKLWDMLGPPAPFLGSAIVMAVLFFIHIALSRRQQHSQA
ncbi:MFS transporter [Paenibacillus anaericanus]|uniref:MFS transporter n=1 Tax=Paenibacillus anaericanus TaxID=170367 RepID=A0A3S1BRC3_9BACL|nr:MFS transporter [Paenibacillus anaericanus]RUT47878.1 MFS transporter [Paenibacillus anaericanus]